MNNKAYHECTRCTHEPVCSFKEIYQQRVSEIKVLEEHIVISVNCIYFDLKVANTRVRTPIPTVGDIHD